MFQKPKAEMARITSAPRNQSAPTRSHSASFPRIWRALCSSREEMTGDFPEIWAGDALASSAQFMKKVCFRRLHWPKGLHSENRVRRAELQLLHRVASPLCRDGEMASRRLWGLTAKVFGKLGE